MAAVLPDQLLPTLPHLGVVQGLANDAYHSIDMLSHSGLVWLARSPAHFFAWMRDNRRPIIERGGQREGTLAHCLILEPEEYPFRYAIGPELSRGSSAWKSFEAAHPNHVCLKPSEAEAAGRQAASVRGDPDIQNLLTRGNAEVSAFWRDPATGVHCRCRPDWVHDTGEGVILLDVKTYSDASPAEFARQVARKRYHWQAAFYSDGYAIASGQPVVGFVFVTVESEWPHLAKATMLNEEALETARREIRPLIDLYAHCNESKHWPGYAPGVEEIALPRWYAQRAED